MCVCNVCENAADENSDVYECIDLGNGVQLEYVGKFCYLGDMLNGGASSWRDKFGICSKGALGMEKV